MFALESLIVLVYTPAAQLYDQEESFPQQAKFKSICQDGKPKSANKGQKPGGTKLSVKGLDSVT